MGRNRRTIADLLSDESFLRWLDGNADQDTAQLWDAWLLNAVENRALFEEAKKLREMTRLNSVQHHNLHQQWTAVEQKLDEPRNVYAYAPQLNHHPSNRQYLYWYTASAVLLAVLIWGFVEQPWMDRSAQYQTVTTDFGQQKRIDLADGSEVILNANSTLRYPANYQDGAELRLDLTGEAYFKVASRKREPDQSRRQFCVTLQ